MPHITRKSLAMPPALALALAVTACGSNTPEGGSGSPEANTSAAAPATTVQESESRESAASGEAQPSSETRAGGDAQAADDAAPGEVRVLIDGRPVEADLSRTHCEWDSDDGVEQLEFDAGLEDDGMLEVEIDMHNPPRLDGFEFDGPGEEDWEAEDHHEQSAQIGIEGDTYTVTSTAREGDSDREAEMVAVFTCPRS